MNNENLVKNTNNPINTPTVGAVAQAPLPQTLAQPIGNSMSEGFNLIPKMTEEEQAVETTKSTFNIGSALGLIGLVVVSLLIVGFNIVSKQQLNQSKKTLANYEKNINQKADVLIANNSIVDRIVMYENVKNNSFSHKEVVDFIQAIVDKAGHIELRNIEISDTLDFTLEGNSTTLEDVSRLWYLLGINDGIETVNLESVGKSENGARFSFEGNFVSNKFIKK